MNIRKIIGYINCICLIFHDVYRPDYSYLQPHHSGYLQHVAVIQLTTPGVWHMVVW